MVDQTTKTRYMISEQQRSLARNKVRSARSCQAVQKSLCQVSSLFLPLHSPDKFQACWVLRCQGMKHWLEQLHPHIDTSFASSHGSFEKSESPGPHWQRPEFGLLGCPLPWHHKSWALSCDEDLHDRCSHLWMQVRESMPKCVSTCNMICLINVQKVQDMVEFFPGRVVIIKTSLQSKHVMVYLSLGTFWEYHQSNQSYRGVQQCETILIWTKAYNTIQHSTVYIYNIYIIIYIYINIYILQNRTSTMSANSTSPAASFTASKPKSIDVCRNDKTIATWKVQSPRNQDLPHRVTPPVWDCNFAGSGLRSLTSILPGLAGDWRSCHLQLQGSKTRYDKMR